MKWKRMLWMCALMFLVSEVQASPASKLAEGAMIGRHYTEADLVYAGRTDNGVNMYTERSGPIADFNQLGECMTVWLANENGYITAFSFMPSSPARARWFINFLTTEMGRPVRKEGQRMWMDFENRVGIGATDNNGSIVFTLAGF